MGFVYFCLTGKHSIGQRWQGCTFICKCDANANAASIETLQKPHWYSAFRLSIIGAKQQLTDYILNDGSIQQPIALNK